jgi:hypothetical protein
MKVTATQRGKLFPGVQVKGYFIVCHEAMPSFSVINPDTLLPVKRREKMSGEMTHIPRRMRGH